jgi:hypothetical protein
MVFLGASRCPPQIVIRYAASHHRMTDIAAQLDLELISPDGAARPYLIRLAMPRPSGEDWQCDVQFGKPTAKVRPIYGVDSWQALTLAMQFARVNLECDIPAGWKVHWHGEPVAVAKLFPHPPAA